MTPQERAAEVVSNWRRDGTRSRDETLRTLIAWAIRDAVLGDDGVKARAEMAREYLDAMNELHEERKRAVPEAVAAERERCLRIILGGDDDGVDGRTVPLEGRDLVDRIRGRADEPVVRAATGGRNGGTA